MLRQQAAWLFRQLWSSHATPNLWANFRVFHQKAPVLSSETGRTIEESKILFNQSYKLDSLIQEWLRPGGLYEKLAQLNAHSVEPGNISFSINPRTSADGNKKADVAFSSAIVLDMDITEQYTLEARSAQLAFLAQCGFPPSFTIFSGHGFHPYFVFESPVPCAQSEEIGKRMTLITGCKGKGNVWDCTRVMRAPGFKNVKNWYRDDTPECVIVQPSWQEIQDAGFETTCRKYPVEMLVKFPPCTTTDMERFAEEASLLDGNYEENLVRVINSYVKVATTQAASEHVAASIAENQTEPSSRNEWVPNKTHVPEDVRNIPWKPQKSRWWCVKYCEEGYDSFTPGDLDKMKAEKAIGDDTSASEFDAKIMYRLISLGYKEEAVLEFWHRETLKLLRPEKIAKSPNYLSSTYNAMLARVREEHSKAPTFVNESGDLEEVPAGAIYVRRKSTFINTTPPRCICNGELKLTEILTTDSDIFWRLTVTFEKGPPGSIFTSRRAFDSLGGFKEMAHKNHQLYCHTDKPADLSKLANHLYDQAPDSAKVSKTLNVNMAYSKDAKTFTFPKLTIKKDSITRIEADIDKTLKEQFPWADDFTDEVPTTEQVKAVIDAHWLDVLSVHVPNLVVGVIGMIGSAAARQIVEAHTTSEIHLPTLNVTGRPSSGKTETVRELIQLAGARQPRELILSAKSSEFALTRLPALVEFVPIPIDEFKVEKENTKYIETLRRLVREGYSGTTMQKGRANLTLRGSKVRGKWIVMGEDLLGRSGNLAEFTRIVVVSTETFIPSEHQDVWNRLVTANLHLLGPLFYQYLLQQDPKALEDAYKRHRDAVMAKITTLFSNEKMRLSNNVGVLTWGAEIYDDFVHSISPNAPRMTDLWNTQDLFVQELINSANDSEERLTYNGSDGKVKIVIKDEALKFIEAVNQMILEKFEPLAAKLPRAPGDRVDDFPFVFKETGDSLLLNLQTCYNLYCEHSKRCGREVPEISRIRERIRGAILRKEEWVTKSSKVMRHGNTFYKALQLNINHVRKMGVWSYHAEEQRPGSETVSFECDDADPDQSTNLG
jgi:hypothetical protein